MTLDDAAGLEGSSGRANVRRAVTVVYAGEAGLREREVALVRWLVPDKPFVKVALAG